MKELSLNVLDITQNSITAGATRIEISIIEKGGSLELTVADNGCGMSHELVERVTNPFYTTRTTRKVGLGIPFLMLAAQQTGGMLEIKSRTAEESPDEHGTSIKAVFNKDSIDFTPLGDMISTVCTIINGCGETDILYLHSTEGGEVHLDTAELKEVLGGDIPLASVEIIMWIKDYLSEQYNNIKTT